MRKAAAEMISVIHSVQRQLSCGFSTIQPPAMGAMTGAVIRVSPGQKKRGYHGAAAYLQHLPTQ
jgi:hypothetical protein